MDILISASLLSAFVAGMAALFAPCCVTVLLPAYLGSIFRQRKTVFLMTLVFFFGVLAVFLPLGLGIAALGQFLKNYHNQLYAIGGLFLVLLGLSILIGQHFSLPFLSRLKRGNGKIENAGSVFVLGIFSGIATLCCAPVLAGVMALSALPGSLFWGAIYSLTYALGMVMPLFVIAYFLDKSNITDKFSFFKKRINYSVIGRKINISVSELVAGLVYLLMGALTLYLNWTGKLAMGGGSYQLSINIYMARLTKFLGQFMDKIPKELWLLAILAALALIVKIAINMMKKTDKVESSEKINGSAASHSCREVEKTNKNE